MVKGRSLVSLGSKLKTGNVATTASISFYVVVGVICFVLLPLADFPPHIGIIGILSIITAYGLFKKRSWTIWFAVMLFFIVTTFSLYTLYYLILRDLLTDISLTSYLVLTWVFTVYVVAKRKTLES
jgi:hypothetical protein